NQDWEDLQRSGDQLYLADIGDNAQSRQQCQVYRFDEPGPLTDTISSVQTIRFRYPDGSRDAEALLVDSSSGDLFIITKRESAARIYRVAAPHSEGTVHVATLAGTLPYGGVTGAAQSPDGKHLLVKTYLTVFHYTRTANESIPDALSRKGKSIAYRAEPQGEAIAFARDGNGFFTLSEIPHAGMPQQLYFYKGNP
ncbi:MAG TPA: hypothetical protein VHK69_18585, partial [Chitinophagaceae bacterium]|nr:hypothetical protein [Chitinophagaceae bacterium]